MRQSAQEVDGATPDFRVLGRLQVVANGRDLTPGRPKQRALLALLLTRTDEVVARDELIEALWGETPPATAQTALHGHVSSLRKLLGPATIETRPPGYLLRVDSEHIDAGRFRVLLGEARAEPEPARRAELFSEALSLFRGEPFSDFRYDAFAGDEIRSLEELRLAALEERIDAELEVGRHGERIPELETLVSAHPLRERLRAQLMLALYRAGRHADALSVFQSGRRILAQELGLEPGPPLRDLERRILSHDASLSPPAAAERPVRGRSPPAGRGRRAPPEPAPLRLARRHPALAAVVGVVLAAAAVLATIVLGGDGAGTRISGDALALIDLASGKLAGSVPLESRPGAVAVGDGAVWATLPDMGTVVRIDSETRRVVDTVPVGADPTGVAAGAGSVWVTNSGGSTVSRISPARKAVVQTIDVPGSPAAIAVSDDGVWVANSVDDTVSRIDPDRGEVVATIAVGDQPVDLAAHRAGVWVANASSGTVSRVGPRPGVAVQTADVGHTPAAIAAGLNGIWVTNLLDGTVSRIDPDTNAVVQTVRVGDSPAGVAVAGGFVWVSDESRGTLRRIDPRSGSVNTIRLGSQAGKIAAGDGALWVSVRGSETAHRGGTLTVVVPDVIDAIDPALAYFSVSWNLLELTNDGLVGFKRVGGRDGATLVPDLARSIPRATDGGRTYSFRLRRGIHYSDGRPVRARDFRRAVERVFALESAGATHYTSILGAKSCRPGSCDLSRGIVADDTAGTVTYHLVRPDPDFLYRLALPFAYAVPTRTPDRAMENASIPATGPYAIERYERSKALVLRRNPQFKVWSPAARPDGFPDRIVWRLSTSEHRQVREVLGGRADLTFFPPPRDRLPALMASHAGQVHLTPQPGIYHMALNTTTPPFSDVRVRRALSFAVDRERIAKLLAGAGRLTCQILPPNYPGYVSYCPYTLEPGRTWQAPDLAQARKLVLASGTAGSRVKVWATPDYAFGLPMPVGRYFVRLLDELGYRARLKVIGGQSDYFGHTLDPSHGAQIAFEGYTSDYPTESGYLLPTLTCNSRGNSAAQFCDPSIDRRMEAATALQVSDPRAAHDRWSSIEHDLVDLAPWLPLVSRVRVNFVAERVGNLQVHLQWGPLLDQIWVR